MPKSHFDACEIAEQIGRWRSYATAIDRKGVSTVRRMPTVCPERARKGRETEKNRQFIAEKLRREGIGAPKRAVWNGQMTVSLQENDEVWKHRDG